MKYLSSMRQAMKQTARRAFVTSAVSSFAAVGTYTGMRRWCDAKTVVEEFLLESAEESSTKRSQRTWLCLLAIFGASHAVGHTVRASLDRQDLNDVMYEFKHVMKSAART